MNVKVRKYDPTVDKEPYYKTYEVPITEYMTVLEALVYIDENLEPLAFDYSCRGRTCGRCSVMLNGVPCTACTKAIQDTDNVVEPLAGVPVVRDLVVDKSAMQDRIGRIAVRVRPEELTWPEIQAPLDKAVYDRLNTTERCARCLVCNAACPARIESPERYIGPAGMVTIARRFFDPYDQGDRVAQAVQEGLWNCIMCGKCDEVCPAQDIKHIEMWNELRQAATARGLTGKSPSVLPFGEKQ